MDNASIKYYSDGESQLALSPFDNYVKFKIAKLDGDDLINISLESVNKVVLNLGSVAVDNTLNYADVELGEGEIMFKIDKATVTKATKQADNTYMLSIVNGTDKTLIHYGKFNVLGNNRADNAAQLNVQSPIN